MEMRSLGTTDMKVTSICLGTMTWGNQNTEADAHEQLDYAISRGLNFIDTAEVYPIPPSREMQGRTETYIGTWLAKRGKRDDLVIATKISSRNQASNIRERDASIGLTRESIRFAINGSLRRLQTDHLDLYQVHVPDRSVNNFGVRGYAESMDEGGASIEETLAALDGLVKEGKMRAIGVSNETPWGVHEYLRVSREKGYVRLATMQQQYSLINRTFEIGLSEFALKEHISLLAYSPLSMGVLSGKYLGGAKPENARFTLFERSRARYNPPQAQAGIARYVDIAKKHGLDPAQMAIAFAASRPFAASAIIGATTMEQLKRNIDAGDVTLSPEVLEDIAQAYLEIPDPTA